MSDTPKYPKQVPDKDGKIKGGQDLVDVIDKAWTDSLRMRDWNEGGVPHVDPDEPVWGTINRAEVD